MPEYRVEVEVLQAGWDARQRRLSEAWWSVTYGGDKKHGKRTAIRRIGAKK